MTNYVFNKLYANPKVLDHLAGENGVVDFRKICPPPDGLFDAGKTGGTNLRAEICASRACNERCIEPLIDGKLPKPEDRSNVLKLDDQAFEEFVSMLRSKRRTGYFRAVDFCIEAWGTNWNASGPEREDDHVTFATAWSVPVPVLVALSGMFPAEIIHVDYFNDFEHDWGHVNLLNGKVRNYSGLIEWMVQYEELKASKQKDHMEETGAAAAH